MADGDKPAEKESGVSKFLHEVKDGASKYINEVKGVVGIFTQASDEAKYIAEQKAPMVEKAAPPKASPPKLGQ